MYIASFKAGWLQIACEAETLNGIMDQFTRQQELDCLVRMGLDYGMAPEKDTEELKRLKRFLNRYHKGTLRECDVRNFNYSLSMGDMRCEQFEKV